MVLKVKLPANDNTRSTIIKLRDPMFCNLYTRYKNAVEKAVSNHAKITKEALNNLPNSTITKFIYKIVSDPSVGDITKNKDS